MCTLCVHPFMVYARACQGTVEGEGHLLCMLGTVQGALPKANKTSLTEILWCLCYEVSVMLEETSSENRLFLYNHNLIIFGVNQLRSPLCPHLHEKRVIIINGD